MSVSIGRLQFEHHREAIGIGESAPRISWRFEGDARDWRQKSYEIEITRLKTSSSQIHKVESRDSVLVPWPGQPLRSRDSASIRVRAFGDGDERGTTWSDHAVVETGILTRNEWTCSLIASRTPTDISAPRQPVLFRRAFTACAPILKARLYITAQGVYEAHLNGMRIGDHVLSPGWTSYTHRLQYQTFDITELLHLGENVISAEVAEGWFCGRLGFLGGKRNIWGNTVGLVAKLVITSTDGSEVVLNSDSEWKSSTGSIITSEIYDGEVCDLSLEPKGWQVPGFDDGSWTRVKTLPLPDAELTAPDGPPVRKIEERKAVSAFRTPSGKTVVDFEQNIVGWVRMRLSGPKGHTIKLQFAEVLEGGEVAVRPLRMCKAADTVTLSGEDQIWEPKFTFHGFRYVQIDGWLEDGEFDLTALSAIVVHTDMEQTGWFHCSNALLNQLHQNIRWGMKGNFLSIPTDCPQRDERLGWTGDIHIFAPTANYLYDTCGMLQGWAKDLSAEQMADGSKIPPFYCPNVSIDDPKYPTAIWGDVSVGLPWSLYMSYGDSNILGHQMESMRGWIDKGIVRDEVSGLWKDGSYQFGDWLDPKAPPDEPGNSVTDPQLVANAYLIHTTTLMSKISVALGLDDLAKRYSESALKLKGEYQKRYITPEGRVVSDSQTAIALSIHFQLFSSLSQESVAAARLRELILRNSRFKIATGFAGTPIIGHALSHIGDAQLFYRMLYHRKAPSWLYQVTMGATTMWERWDSMLPDGSINPGEMTSFNHYALGAVADWMHSNIIGLTALEPGWRKFRIAPIPGGDLTRSAGRFLSPYGLINVQWVIEGSQFLLMTSIPPSTTAEILLPGGKQDHAIIVGSGTYEFKVDYKRPAWPPVPIYPQYYPHDDDEP